VLAYLNGFKRFKVSRTSVDDDKRSGPASAGRNDFVTRVRGLILLG
jgi:hypothetical protein